MNNMRVSNNDTEISKTLYQMYLENTCITVWQNTNNKRQIGHCFISKMDIDTRQMVLQAEFESPINFDETFHIYIYGEDKSIVFKNNIVRRKGDEFLLSFPEEVYLLEKRENRRIAIPYNSREIPISAFLTSDQSKSPKIFKFKLMDFSESGLGVEVLGKLNKYFYENDTVTFIYLDSKNLPRPINAKIRYISPTDSSNMRLGLQFERALKQKDYQRFLQTVDSLQKVA